MATPAANRPLNLRASASSSGVFRSARVVQWMPARMIAMKLPMVAKMNRLE